MNGPRTASFAATVLILAGSGSCGAAENESSGNATQDGLVSRGESLYEQTCAGCHGSDLQGTHSGPPFLDVIYAPNHHPDEAFYAAVENGVQPHHWDFGPMPPQPSVTREELAAIIAFVRSRQTEAGITHDPSHP